MFVMFLFDSVNSLFDVCGGAPELVNMFQLRCFMCDLGSSLCSSYIQLYLRSRQHKGCLCCLIVHMCIHLLTVCLMMSFEF